MEQSSLPENTEPYKTASVLRRKHIPCDAERCDQDAICSLELRFLCLGHFISHSYQRLEYWKTFAYCDPAGTTQESNARFLEECLLRAENLLRSMESIDNLSRARLFDIILWASEVSAKRNASEKTGHAGTRPRWQISSSGPTP